MQQAVGSSQASIAPHCFHRWKVTCYSNHYSLAASQRWSCSSSERLLVCSLRRSWRHFPRSCRGLDCDVSTPKATDDVAHTCESFRHVDMALRYCLYFWCRLVDWWQLVSVLLSCWMPLAPKERTCSPTSCHCRWCQDQRQASALDQRKLRAAEPMKSRLTPKPSKPFAPRRPTSCTMIKPMQSFRKCCRISIAPMLWGSSSSRIWSTKQMASLFVVAWLTPSWSILAKQTLCGQLCWDIAAIALSLTPMEKVSCKRGHAQFSLGSASECRSVITLTAKMNHAQCDTWRCAKATACSTRKVGELGVNYPPQNKARRPCKWIQHSRCWFGAGHARQGQRKGLRGGTAFQILFAPAHNKGVAAGS